MTYSKELKIKAEIAEAIEGQIGAYERMLQWERDSFERYQNECADKGEEIDTVTITYHEEQIRAAEENLEACKKIVADLLKKF